jgi:hypothetical protein
MLAFAQIQLVLEASATSPVANTKLAATNVDMQGIGILVLAFAVHVIRSLLLARWTDTSSSLLPCPESLVHRSSKSKPNGRCGKERGDKEIAPEMKFSRIEEASGIPHIHPSSGSD